MRYGCVCCDAWVKVQKREAQSLTPIMALYHGSSFCASVTAVECSFCHRAVRELIAEHRLRVTVAFEPIRKANKLAVREVSPTLTMKRTVSPALSASIIFASWMCSATALWASASPGKELTSTQACMQNMIKLGNYDFMDFLSPSETRMYSWIDRELAAQAQHLTDAAAINTSGSNQTRTEYISLCEMVLRYYPSINDIHDLSVTQEMRVRMLVDFVYRIIPWRERGVEDNGISVYENLHNIEPESRIKRDLAEAFLHYESNLGSVVCGGFAWMLSWTLQYFGYWSVVLDSKLKHSVVPDNIREGDIVNGHHTVMARICKDHSRNCKWVHLDPSIGSVIVVKGSQELASFFDVIESFYHLQSDDGYEVVPAWTHLTNAPQPRSLISVSALHCSTQWTLLDVCTSNLEVVAIPSRSDAAVLFAPRTMKNMVSEVVLPAHVTSWWFYNTPGSLIRNFVLNTVPDGQNWAQNARQDSHTICSNLTVASVRPPCLSNANCTKLTDEHLKKVNAVLMTTKIQCAADAVSYLEQLEWSNSNFQELTHQFREFDRQKEDIDANSSPFLHLLQSLRTKYLVVDSSLRCTRFLQRHEKLHSHASRYFVWLMRCSTMEARIFAGPNGQLVQDCRNTVQSTSNSNPASKKTHPYTRPECVSKLESFPSHTRQDEYFLNLFVSPTTQVQSATEFTTPAQTSTIPSLFLANIQSQTGKPLLRTVAAIDNQQLSSSQYNQPLMNNSSRVNKTFIIPYKNRIFILNTDFNSGLETMQLNLFFLLIVLVPILFAHRTIKSFRRHKKLCNTSEVRQTEPSLCTTAAKAEIGGQSRKMID